MRIATPEAFARDPALVYRFYNARRNQLQDVYPNDAHRALARLQAEFPGDVFLVTQNVDDLHERGGSEQVCHMHGQLNRMLCQTCTSTLAVIADYDGGSRCPQCGVRGKLRPDIVWFGEVPYHMETIGAKLRTCDLFIAVGSSGIVYPAAGFVQEALAGGAQTVEVNRELSEVTGFFHRQRRGMATEEVVALVEELLVD
jgi:NAD-dependent deacetylase